jgi:tol-pal system protein YbgF
VKKFLSCLLLAAAGCASRADDDPAKNVPSLVPPAQLEQAGGRTAEARLAELQTSMTELLERLDVLNDRINRLEQSQAAAALPGARPEAAPAPKSSPASPAPAVSHPATADRAVVSAQIADAYREALVLYGKGKFAESRAAFQRVFEADPSGDLADNALYWIGETWFAAGNYAEAMRQYKRVTTEFAESNKAPDALFKTALALEKSGDLALARTTLDEVIRRYPFSSSAASAKLELKRIKY